MVILEQCQTGQKLSFFITLFPDKLVS